MRAVNLLPKDTGRTAGGAPKVVPLVLLVGGAAVVLGLGGFFVASDSAHSAQEEALAAKQAELAAVPRATGVPATPDPVNYALAAQRGPRVSALTAALAERVTWDRVLRRFALVLPDDVWLQSLTLTGPGAEAAAPADAAGAEQAAAAADGFTVTGRTYTHDGVARMLSRLVALPDLEDVRLQTSSRVEVAGQKVVEFTIVAGVRTDGESS